MIVPRENNTRRKTFGDGNQYLLLFEFYIIFEERPKRARKTEKGDDENSSSVRVPLGKGAAFLHEKDWSFRVK